MDQKQKSTLEKVGTEARCTFNKICAQFRIAFEGQKNKKVH